MVINDDLLIKIKSYHLNLDELIVLYSKYFNTSWVPTYYSPMDIVYNKLRREEYLDSTNNITSKGTELMGKLINKNQISEEEVFEQKFNEFWLAYPSSDAWGYFPTKRAIRNNKKRSRELYLALMREGVEPQTLLQALNNEVSTRKKNSTSTNELSYMQGTATWLFNRTFEAWVKKEDNVQNELYGKELS